LSCRALGNDREHLGVRNGKRCAHDAGTTVLETHRSLDEALRLAAIERIDEYTVLLADEAPPHLRDVVLRGMMLEELIALEEGRFHHVIERYGGASDLKSAQRATLALAHLKAGEPQQALALAQELSHLYSLAHARCVAATVAQLQQWAAERR